MGDEPATPPAPAGTPPAQPGDTFTPPATQADLDKIIESRLARERSKFADYDELKRKAGEFDKLDEASKSDLQKAADAAAEAAKRADAAEARALRLEVAQSKGLTAAQAKRLAGTTKEELEADADEILEAFPAAAPNPGAPPSTRPRPSLKGGTDPTSDTDEMDPAKLAEGVPRF